MAHRPRADFRDRFGGAAPAYAAYRPRYPAALFTALATLAPARCRAWDCATGSGQAAIGLAEYFDEVIATDASAAQLAAAQAHPRVRYGRAPAEASGLPARSVDLVTVAQALHWLDTPAFYAEVRRVLVPGGVLAVWCYGLVTIGSGVDELIGDFYHETVGPYWPPERAHVESGYRTIDFPFAELVLPPLVMEAAVTLEELAGYLGTWSAVLRYREARGRDPIPALVERLRAPWGAAERRRTARWDLAVRAGRLPPPPPLR
ncbi:MAG TPA: class I SAM-dependent methyltransferase [Gemmatimonadales bacterium]|nr:class I SAM-dependent methyltransferase [Gemmatimonadales bacterium]